MLTTVQVNIGKSKCIGSDKTIIKETKGTLLRNKYLYLLYV